METDSSEDMLGAMLSPPDDRDLIIEGLGAAIYSSDNPPEEYLIDYSGPPFNQGSAYTCVACVGALLVEIHESLNSKTSPKTSRRLSSNFIYHHRVNEASRGMFGRHAFRIMKNLGVSSEDSYGSDDSGAPSKKAYRDAAERKIAGYAMVSTCEALKRALVEIGPAYMLLPCHSQKKRFWEPTKQRPEPKGYHAVTVIGYTRDSFVIINSWGIDWGKHGRAQFPFTAWECVREVWVPLRRRDPVRKERRRSMIGAMLHVGDDRGVSGIREELSPSESTSSTEPVRKERRRSIMGSLLHVGADRADHSESTSPTSGTVGRRGKSRSRLAGFLGDIM